MSLPTSTSMSKFVWVTKGTFWVYKNAIDTTALLNPQCDASGEIVAGEVLRRVKSQEIKDVVEFISVEELRQRRRDCCDYHSGSGAKQECLQVVRALDRLEKSHSCDSAHEEKKKRLECKIISTEELSKRYHDNTCGRSVKRYEFAPNAFPGGSQCEKTTGNNSASELGRIAPPPLVVEPNPNVSEPIVISPVSESIIAASPVPEEKPGTPSENASVQSVASVEHTCEQLCLADENGKEGADEQEQRDAAQILCALAAHRETAAVKYETGEPSSGKENSRQLGRKKPRLQSHEDTVPEVLSVATDIGFFGRSERRLFSERNTAVTCAPVAKLKHKQQSFVPQRPHQHYPELDSMSGMSREEFAAALEAMKAAVRVCRH